VPPVLSRTMAHYLFPILLMPSTTDRPHVNLARRKEVQESWSLRKGTVWFLTMNAAQGLVLLMPQECLNQCERKAEPVVYHHKETRPAELGVARCQLYRLGSCEELLDAHARTWRLCTMQATSEVDAQTQPKGCIHEHDWHCIMF